MTKRKIIQELKFALKVLSRDLLEATKWWMLGLIVLDLALDKDIETLTGINVYMCIVIFLLACGLSILFAPWLVMTKK